MHDAAGLADDPARASPLMVSLVQARPPCRSSSRSSAGALADVLDRRRVLLVAQVWLFLMTVTGVLTIAGVVQPGCSS